MKRLLLLIGLVVGAGLISLASAATFADVAGTRYGEAYAYLSARSAVSGYSDGSGRPHAPITRVEALKVLTTIRPEYQVQVSRMNGRAPTLPLFRDLKQTAWYAPSVEVAFRQGIVTGYPDRTFRPAQVLRTEEAVALLLRAYREPGGSRVARSSVSLQNASGQWFTPYVNAAIEKNLVSGRERLRVGTAITRGQFFDMVYRMDTIRTQRLASFNRPEAIVAPVTTGAVRPGTVTSPQPTRPGYASNQFSITIPGLGMKDITIGHPANPNASQGLLAPLRYGLGHLFSYPGGNGKILVYGHSSSYAWDVSPYTKIFRRINELRRGDRVYITYGNRMHVYQLSYSETVPASDTSRYKGVGEELILYTCWPPDNITYRFLWHATPVETIALR